MAVDVQYCFAYILSMSTNLLRQFSNKIKRMRTQRGLTQEGLALICNLDRTYIGRLERMERSPSLGTLKKLADGLGITLSDLLDF